MGEAVETSLARLTATTDRIEAEQGALRSDVTAMRGALEEVQVGLGAIGAQTTAILDLLRNPST